MKRLAVLLMVAVLGVTSAAAAEELILTGVVEGRETIALKAPASGELAHFTIRAGDVAAAGSTLFEVEPVRVYADSTGTVAAVHAQAGGSADAAVSRYGAVVQVEYADRYELQANVMTGHKSPENRDLRVGMPVYLLSNNEEDEAEGVITAVNGSNFTVQVFGTDLVFTHTIRIYREKDYQNKYLLAKAALSAVAPRSYTASGTVTEMTVRAGDAVKPGDELFSYVPDVLDPQRPDTAVRPDGELIITAVHVQQGASVQKGQALASAVRMGDYELTAQVEESDVGRLQVGDVLTASFEEANLPAAEARVVSISPLGTAEGDTSVFTVRFAFEAPQGVWPGMHAVLQKAE